MSKETVGTIGNQKKTNYALPDMTEAEFIKEVTEGLLPPPAYFGMNVAMNKQGYESFETVLNNGMRAINVKDLETVAEDWTLILDTRNNGDFAKGFILNP
jgi:hypothetical protein